MTAPEPVDHDGASRDDEDELGAFERFENLAKALVKVPKDQVDAIIKKRRKG